ncbi:flexible cuticle protein 12-like isoform X1 [Condylostylus longicornis]|uniref:flexible cuticle protein 12-like isoform X1 n=1 Tax=Condylostylus longicornis TaxID=2530218 RepID=UPI00244E4EAB|nr:flexible cuticle protein 12-like isoform X1 [Condylostylus longicornis]
MKFVIVLAALFAVAIAAPADVEIVRYDNDNIGVEGYKFGVETSDGKKHDESGQLKNVGTEQEGIAVQGSFSYVGDDGQTYSVSYVADENGFQPTGAHIPVAA